MAGQPAEVVLPEDDQIAHVCVGPALVVEIVGQVAVGGEGDRARGGPRVEDARGDLAVEAPPRGVGGEEEGMALRSVAVQDEAVHDVVLEAQDGAVDAVYVIDAVRHGNVVFAYDGGGVCVLRVVAQGHLAAVHHAVAVAVGVGGVGVEGHFLGVEQAVAVGIGANLYGTEQDVSPSAVVVLVSHAHQVGAQAEARRGQLGGQDGLHL